MGFAYKYLRNSFEDGRYDIDNPFRVSPYGSQIFLAVEVENALPGKKFIIKCHDNNVDIIFEEALSDEEKMMLDLIVANHKTNT